MEYLKYLLLLLFLIDFGLYLRHNFHMYQLNYYKMSTQMKWISKNKQMLIAYSVIYVLMMIMIVFFKYGILGACIMYFFTCLLHKPKTAKKKFVFTGRVKRTYTACYLFIVIVSSILYLIKGEQLVLDMLPVLSILTPFILFVGDIMIVPINKAINNRYIKEAKNKLEGLKNLKIIGVTGSYGKTSTKNYLKAFLETKYNVLMTPGNLNTTLGVVRTVRENLKATHDIFVCEMGADRVHDIKEICDLVHPDYGVITSIGPQHLETFKTQENIINTKFELADAIENNKVFLNYDNEYIKNHKCNKDIVRYGVSNNKLDYKAYDIKASDKGLTFKMKDKDGKEVEFKTKLLGNHNVVNIVGAIAVAEEFGIPMKSLVKKVANLENVKHRLELIPGVNKTIIDDAYNSNPIGAASALDALKMFDGVKILVTPGMVELGEKEYEYNYEFGVHASKVCDYIFLVGAKQTKAIFEGVCSTKYNKDKIKVVDSLKEAMRIVDQIKTAGKHKTVLLENDLPDQY